jgi:hypothetical protein
MKTSGNDRHAMNEEADQNAAVPGVPIAQVVGTESAPAKLWYATAGNIQPPNSRIVCEILPDGVRLTEPAYFLQGWRQWFFGFFPMIIGIVLVVGDRMEHGRPTLIGILFLLFAVVLIGEGWRRGTRPLVIEADCRHLTVIQPSLLMRRIRWSRDSIAGITTQTISVGLNGKPFARILLKKQWGLSAAILGTRPKDECLWIASVLRQTMGFDQPGGG